MSTKRNHDPGLNLIDRIAVWLLGPALLPFLLVARQRERQQAQERARKRRETGEKQ
jgi:hypothetical protein